MLKNEETNKKRKEGKWYKKINDNEIIYTRASENRNKI